MGGVSVHFYVKLQLLNKGCNYNVIFEIFNESLEFSSKIKFQLQNISCNLINQEKNQRVRSEEGEILVNLLFSRELICSPWGRRCGYKRPLRA